MDYPGNDRRPDAAPTPPNLGIFDRINNYLLLFYAAACLLMDYSLAGFFYYKKQIILSLVLPGVLSILVPFYLLSQRSAFGFLREFRLTFPRLRTLAISVVLAGSAIIPIDAFSSIFQRKWPQDTDYISFILSIKPKGPMSFVLIALGIVLVAAVTEELLFRGFVQRIFERNMGGALAFILAGVLFGLSHFNPPAFPGIAALGILFGYIYYRTGNLWNSIFGHALFNAVTLVRLNSMTPEQVASTAVESPPLKWVAVSAVVLVASLWFLSRTNSGSSSGETSVPPPGA
jgi:membrane protease YdiL (CAAX protease family)